MYPYFEHNEIQIDIIPLLGTFVDDRFSHAIRVTHLATQIIVYRSPFDFPEPKLRDELMETSLSELQEKVERKLSRFERSYRNVATSLQFGPMEKF